MTPSPRLRLLLARRKRLRKRPPPPRFPHGIASGYEADLGRIAAAIEKAVREVMLPRLPSLLASASSGRPEPVKVDDVVDDTDLLVQAVFSAYRREVPIEQVEGIVRARATDISRFNKRDLGRVLAAVIGVDPLGSEPWLQAEEAVFVKANVDLVTRMEEDTRGRLRTAVTEAARAGVRSEELADEVLGIAKVADSRARLIARDQVSKYNGELNRLRQTEVGISEYVWETAGDDRVRPSHEAHDGKTYSWGDPPGDTGHPGEDYQCRCVPIPVIPGGPVEG